jgi:hypothetical protein
LLARALKYGGLLVLSREWDHMDAETFEATCRLFKINLKG